MGLVMDVTGTIGVALVSSLAKVTDWANQGVELVEDIASARNVFATAQRAARS